MAATNMTMTATPERVTVRHATARDKAQLADLAALDSSGPIGDAALVAESDGHILAALPLGSGRPIADPFERTAELVVLLELRASQLRIGRASRPGFRDRLRGLLTAKAVTRGATAA